MKSYVFAVYDSQNRVVALYANEIWANRKAKTSKNYHVESYVHVGNRRALELEEYLTRNRTTKVDGKS